MPKNGTLRRATKRLLTTVASRCSQQESRPDGAWRLTIPCCPGLNALGYRISPLSGLENDLVARHANIMVPRAAVSKPREKHSIERQALPALSPAPQDSRRSPGMSSAITLAAVTVVGRSRPSATDDGRCHNDRGARPQHQPVYRRDADDCHVLSLAVGRLGGKPVAVHPEQRHARR